MARKGKKGRARRLLTAAARLILAAAVIGLAVWFVRRDVLALRWSEVEAALRAVGAPRIAACVACVIGSFACLAVNEYYAFRASGRRLPFARTAGVSAYVNAIANAAGFGLFTGTALRLRAYGRDHLDAKAAGAAALRLNAISVLAGLVTLGAALLATRGLPLSPAVRIGAGLLLVSLSAAWFLVPVRGLRSWERAASLAGALGDWLFSALGLYVVSLHAEAVGPFAVRFMLGSVAGWIAGLPGGIGPLEAAVLGRSASRLHQAAAGLMLFRLIFYALPLGLAVLGLGQRALRKRFETP